MRLFQGMCAALLAAACMDASAEDRVLSALHAKLFPTLAPLRQDALPDRTRATLRTRAERWKRCTGVPACQLEAARWTPEEVDALAAASATQRDALRRELQGINVILDVYGKGVAPRYPAIDGPIGTQGSERLSTDLAVAALLNEVGSAEAFNQLDPSVGLALALLDSNHRLDAIAFDPIDAGLNAAPFAFARTLDWARSPYTAIIVLGAGPEEAPTRLSARGKLHVATAAARYRAGLAPFLIVSGGAVHPRDTRFVEAVEMRRELIERFGIPEHAVVIEPYARHTTTNLRNANRLLTAMGAPADRDALVLSDPTHIDYVASPKFEQRNLDELGYQPGTVGQRTSKFDIRFRPSKDSLRVDPQDPLDP